MKITKIIFSLFAVVLLSSFTNNSTNLSTTFGTELEGKTGVKMMNTTMNRILGLDDQGNLALYPNDGIGQSKAAKWDYMAVNYRNNEAGVYIFLGGTDKVMLRTVKGTIELRSYSSLNACETEMARWEYGVMMTGGAETIRYQFESKSSFENMRALYVDNSDSSLKVSNGEFVEHTLWRLEEGGKNGLKVTPRR